MPETDENENLKLKLLGPITTSVGETLQDAWELVFGRFSDYVDKKRMTRRKALEDFKATLETQVNKIPTNQLCDPPLAIVGPALDASKYYFEEEKIRNMFAGVISASMDARVSSLVHPSFPAIIQQLSTTDAKNLLCFYQKGTLPLCEYQIKFLEDSDNDFLLIKPFRVIQTNVFLSNPQVCDIEQGAVSIETLARLGLITVSYEKAIDDSYYKIFEETSEYRSIISKCEKNPMELPYIQRGSADLTPLGENLCTICFSNRSHSDE